MNYWQDKCGGNLDNMKSKERSLSLSQGEVEILTSQLAHRMDELDTHIKEKATKGLNFDGAYELKKTLNSIQERLYQIL